MPLQSLKTFTILYCGTRPNTIVPRQTRSVSPVKENSTAEKSKPSVFGGQRRGSSPTRQGQRSLTQSTPLFAANQRRTSEKNDSISTTGNGSKDNTTNSALSKAGKTSVNVKTTFSVKLASENRMKEDNEKHEKCKATSDEKEPDDESKSDSKSEVRSKGSTLVVDTLSKTTDSLNEATSALGKISQSLNQGGLTDSLLEEVKLKMTHAETINSGTMSNSSPPTRERENLERGN